MTTAYLHCILQRLGTKTPTYIICDAHFACTHTHSDTYTLDDCNQLWSSSKNDHILPWPGEEELYEPRAPDPLPSSPCLTRRNNTDGGSGVLSVTHTQLAKQNVCTIYTHQHGYAVTYIHRKNATNCKSPTPHLKPYIARWRGTGTVFWCCMCTCSGVQHSSIDMPPMHPPWPCKIDLYWQYVDQVC